MPLSFLDDALMIFSLVAGCTIVGTFVFLLMRKKYEEIEAWVFRGIGDYGAKIYDLLDRMFIRKTMNWCYGLVVVSTGVFGLIGLFVGIRFGLLPAAIATFVLGAIGFKLPGMVVEFLFNRRIAKFDRQLVDALAMMSNALKSGLAFMQVVQVIEKEMPSPCSDEFGLVLKENRVGVNINDALLNMTKRVPSDDLFMIINSVVTLSQQGGDLSEAFETIAETIRERQRVKEKIKTMANAGITQGVILSSLPFAMLAVFYYMQPEVTGLLFTTTLGNLMLGGMCVLIGFGILWMRKILQVDI